MITLNLVHILLFLTFAAACVGFYLFYKEKENTKKILVDKDKTCETLIIKLKEEHEKELQAIQQEIKELEELAKEKIEKTENAYVEAIKSLNEEVEFYQKYMLDVNTAITLADNKLKEIDVSGTFATDDEIGWFFKTVKDIQKILNEFKTEVQDRKF